MFYITNNPISIKGLKVEDRIKFFLEERMINNKITKPSDVKKECHLRKGVYDYLRKFEKNGVTEVERENSRYRNIKLTKKGLQDNQKKRSFLRSLID